MPKIQVTDENKNKVDGNDSDSFHEDSSITSDENDDNVIIEESDEDGLRPSQMTIDDHPPQDIKDQDKEEDKLQSNKDMEIGEHENFDMLAVKHRQQRNFTQQVK